VRPSDVQPPKVPRRGKDHRVRVKREEVKEKEKQQQKKKKKKVDDLQTIFAWHKC
jgi:hypothetical protein